MREESLTYGQFLKAYRDRRKAWQVSKNKIKAQLHIEKKFLLAKILSTRIDYIRRLESRHLATTFDFQVPGSLLLILTFRSNSFLV